VGDPTRSRSEALRGYRRLRRRLRLALDRGQDYAAARALLDLLSLCHAHRCARAYGTLAGPVRVLHSSSSQLHLRARLVVEFAAHVVQAWSGSPHIPEVLDNAKAYLDASRFCPALEFFPTLQAPLIYLDWDQLDIELRRNLCREVGAAETLAASSANELDPYLRDWLSWAYELRRRVRVTFSPNLEP
jgi:hypothetical protein